MSVGSKQGYVILSADDDEDSGFLLKRAFTKAGVKATLLQVKDGSDVISYLKGEGEFANRTEFPLPDLLLLDLNMPTSGLDVLAYLSSRSEGRTFTTVVLSSSERPDDMHKAHALGCDAYLTKPCNFEKLVELAKEIDAGLLSTDLGERKRALTRSEIPSNEPNNIEPVNNDSIQPIPTAYDSPEFFRLLVEQVKDYAIFMLDPGGVIRSWNEGARRIKGYEPSEIIGQHFSVFYPLPDIETDKPGYELRMAQEMGRYEEEGWRVRKDKSRFWANVVITPLRDKDGKLQGYAKVTRDLTQTKLQEESFQRLLESEERFRLLVEQVKDYAIFMLDARGNVISWNQGARRIKGYTADEIIGKHFSIFYTQDALAQDHPAKELTMAIRDGRYEEEGWRKRKDGSRFWANVVITALWDKRGNLSGFAKVTRDLTQKKMAQDALRQKNEALEAFAHTLSHDLRAPLRSITSFADILGAEGNQLAEEEKERYFKKIKKSAESMNVMITEILKLSQVTNVPAPERNVSLGAVLDEVLQLLEAEIKRTRAEIDIKRPLPGVFGNQTLLVQIFSNLVANALKFILPGQTPRIQVYTTFNDGHCEIHVRDQGLGIPDDVRESIFTAFERGNAGNKIAGIGVGLAIVRKAAERMGGSVAVRSKVGQGSDFIVNLRCAVEEEAPA